MKGKKVGISRLGGASDFSIRYALTHWGLVPEKDVALIQVGGEPEEVLALQNKAVDAVILVRAVCHGCQAGRRDYAG